MTVNRSRLCLEDLEGRDVPAIVSFTVNTTDDTPFAVYAPKFPMAPPVPQDANGNTSLRAVVEWGNANPQNGDWNTNRINVYLPQGTITLTQNAQLNLDTNFNILANNGPVTIARSTAANTPTFRHFEVGAGTDNRLTGLTLTNGNSTGDGGSIRVHGTAYISGCTFTSNHADGSGGAIAIAKDGKTYLTTSTLSSNSAGVNGGAVAALKDSLATSIGSCAVSNNTADGNGGGVSAVESASLDIATSGITFNKGTQLASHGGGVFVYKVTNATISNYTQINHNESVGEGGGLYVFETDLNMTNGSLAYNTAALDGGGFYVFGNGFTVTLNSVSVTDNEATGGKGGGGYLQAGTLAGSLTALTGNTSGVAGFQGIAWLTGSTATITVPANQQTKVNDP